MVAFGATAGGIAAIGGGDGGATGGGIAAIGGGATARSPDSVSTIGDIGADTQSSPSSTLPSAIASTAP